MTKAAYGATAWRIQCNLQILQVIMNCYVQTSEKDERKMFADIIVNHALGLLGDAIDLEREES